MIRKTESSVRGRRALYEKSIKKPNLRCFYWLFFLATIPLLTISAVQAEEDDDRMPSAAIALESLGNVAMVEVDGTPFFEVVGSRSLPADQRASQISSRIITAAKIDPDRLARVDVRSEGLGPAVYANDELIVFVTDIDASLEGASVDVVLELRTIQITDAIQAYRDARTPAAYLRGGIYVGVWTVVFALFCAAFWYVRKRWVRRAEIRIQKWVNNLEKQTGKVVDASSVIATQKLLFKALVVVILAIATLYYIGRVLFEFPLTKPIATVFLNLVAKPVIALLRTGADELPNLLTIAFIVLVTSFIIKLLRLSFQNIEIGFFKIENFEKRWVWPTYRIVRMLIFIAAFVIAFPYIPGSDGAAFQGISVMLGIMFTLSANSIASNFLNGLVVMYKRSIMEGDRIKVGQNVGVVENMSMLETHIRTRQNELVSVPNSKIISDEVVNMSQTGGSRGLMIIVSVGIGYEEAPDKVRNLLLTAASTTEGIKSVPKPSVQIPVLGSHDVTYELLAYAKVDIPPALVRSNLNWAVLEEFNKAGVQIMTPFYTADPDVPKIPESK